MFDPNTMINRKQKVLTAEQYKKLIANGQNPDQDHAPVVKFFNPFGAATWLISELDEDGTAFGLCDLGFGSPELGYVTLQELCDVQKMRSLGLERDLHFKGEHPMSWYTNKANADGGIRV